MDALHHDWEEVPSRWLEFIHTPMEYADIRLLFGDQGQGKSITTIAMMEDDVRKYITHVVTPESEVIKANSLNEIEQLYLEQELGIPYNNLCHVRIYNNDGTKSKIVKIPLNYGIVTPVKVFANRTIYGMKAAPFTMDKVIEYINTDLMNNSWIISSESVLFDRMESSQSYTSRFTNWFGSEVRKRHIRMAIDMQYRRQLKPIYHLFASTTVECSYDKETGIVDLEVNKASPVMESTYYDSTPYRGFFDTDEHMEIPQDKIDKAMQSIMG